MKWAIPVHCVNTVSSSCQCLWANQFFCSFDQLFIEISIIWWWVDVTKHIEHRSENYLIFHQEKSRTCSDIEFLENIFLTLQWSIWRFEELISENFRKWKLVPCMGVIIWKLSWEHVPNWHDMASPAVNEWNHCAKVHRDQHLATVLFTCHRDDYTFTFDRPRNAAKTFDVHVKSKSSTGVSAAAASSQVWEYVLLQHYIITTLPYSATSASKS